MENGLLEVPYKSYKKMRKIYLIVLVLVTIILLGCIKDRSSSRLIKAQMVTSADGVIIPSEEYLVELYHATDIQIGLIANANFGNLVSQRMVASKMDIDIILSDQTFHFKKGVNPCGYNDSSLLELFGKVHDMSIVVGDKISKYKFYIPELVTAYLSENSWENGLKRTGSVIHWNSDSQYPTKVLFEYELYASDPIHNERLYTSSAIVDDNGTLNLDELLSNQDVKAVIFSIYRINAIEVNVEGKKAALAFTTVDHHMYMIAD